MQNDKILSIIILSTDKDWTCFCFNVDGERFLREYICTQWPAINYNLIHIYYKYKCMNKQNIEMGKYVHETTNLIWIKKCSIIVLDRLQDVRIKLWVPNI